MGTRENRERAREVGKRREGEASRERKSGEREQQIETGIKCVLTEVESLYESKVMKHFLSVSECSISPLPLPPSGQDWGDRRRMWGRWITCPAAVIGLAVLKAPL